VTYHLQQNHTEYWKTIRRDGFSEGFSWFPTWPTRRFFRWPIGLRWPSVFEGWVWKYDTKSLEDDGRFQMVQYMATDLWFEMVITPNTYNPRQGWDKDGREIIAP